MSSQDVINSSFPAGSREEARFTTGDLTTEQLLEILLDTTPDFPDELEGQNYPDVWPWDTHKESSRYMLGKNAYCPESFAALVETVFKEVSDPISITASNVIPDVRRGSSVVPNLIASPVSLIDYTVPMGYSQWIMGYALDLTPSKVDELNYVWQILIGGQDILNKSGAVQAGRPIKNNDQVIIGTTKSTMILAGPGTRIQVTVTALNDLGSSNVADCSLFVALEALQP